MPQPDVSVVIPVHNGESFVCDALDSVFAQQSAWLEVIVVDNNSADRTRQIVEARYGSRVRIAGEPRPGAAHARNRGARMASATYLAFLDADDIWSPGKLNAQLNAIAAGADIAFSHCVEFHDEVLDENARAQYPCRPSPYPMLMPSAYFSRTEVFRHAGEFPDFPAGEFIAWYGWAQTLGLRTTVLPEVLVRRRVHANNSTRDRGNLAGFPMAAKWLLDKRRQRTVPS